MNEEIEKIEIKWKGNITLVRHGETDFNKENRFIGRTDKKLNRKGLEQAKTTAAFIVGWSLSSKIYFNQVLSSPLKRCVQTAKEISKTLGLKTIKEDLLIERHYGIFEGLTHIEASEQFPELYSDYQINKPYVELPSGESVFDVENRIKSLLTEKIPIEFKKSKEILIVTHLNPIRAILRLLNLADWEIYFKSFNNSSITRINIDDGKYKLEYCDKCPDL